MRGKIWNPWTESYTHWSPYWRAEQEIGQFLAWLGVFSVIVMWTR